MVKAKSKRKPSVSKKELVDSLHAAQSDLKKMKKLNDAIIKRGDEISEENERFKLALGNTQTAIESIENEHSEEYVKLNKKIDELIAFIKTKPTP
jgi:hypothetical protein